MAPRISLALSSLPCLRINGRLPSPQIHKLFCGVTAPGEPRPSASTVQAALGKTPGSDTHPHSDPIAGGTQVSSRAVSSGSQQHLQPQPLLLPPYRPEHPQES